MSKYLVAATLIILILLSTVFSGTSELEVAFLDVGQGDAILVRAPSGQNILIDGGPDNRLLSQVAAVLPWWERKIDYLIISHYHADHLVGLIELLNKYEIGQILVTAHDPQADFLYQTWLTVLAEHKLNPTIVEAGEKFVLGDSLSLQILSAENSHEDYNENSLVTRLTYGQIDFLLMGDLPSIGEERLLRSDLDLQSEILKVGHHGSKYSSSAEFLSLVRPQLCVIQSGQDNKFGHPHTETLDRLAQAGCQIVNTQEDGTIRTRSNGQKWLVDKSLTP